MEGNTVVWNLILFDEFFFACHKFRLETILIDYYLITNLIYFGGRKYNNGRTYNIVCLEFHPSDSIKIMPCFFNTTLLRLGRSVLSLSTSGMWIITWTPTSTAENLLSDRIIIRVIWFLKFA